MHSKFVRSYQEPLGNFKQIQICFINKLRSSGRLWQYLSYHSTLGRYIHRTYRIESNAHILLSVLSRGLLQIILYRCSHDLIIWPNCYIAVMELAAVPPEVFLH